MSIEIARRDLDFELARVTRTAQRLAEANATENGRLRAWCRSRLDTLTPLLAERLADVIDEQELALAPPIVDDQDDDVDDFEDEAA